MPKTTKSSKVWAGSVERFFETRPWTQKLYAERADGTTAWWNDPLATKWSLCGAIKWVVIGEEAQQSLRSDLEQLCRNDGFAHLEAWEGYPLRTFDEVKDLLRRLIESSWVR